ncbi:neuraminidase-like domain-containing protein [Arcicella sp. LKC2W]|uniref:Tc toxin subunit A-related protein n=1 Tax=Arcicella sp. LKC2W TaxID=2984198 RepID=UPI002B1F6116|nr:neuraminidase-like domain-containing protein [Arcicella sp. LKC2W]MEA5461682.1 neuraminidase-like domain-containing protein [Arcicella sp. LKC2W]
MANSNHLYIVSGCITDKQNKQPIEGLKVYAFDLDPKTPENPLGTFAMTDVQGRYKIEYTEKDFRIDDMESGGPDLIIRVFDGDTLLGESKMRRNSKRETTIDLSVEYVKSDPNEPKRKVFGIVRDKFGKPLNNVILNIFDKDLRNQELLGKTQTNEGKYEVFYTKSQFKKSEKESADILIEIHNQKGERIYKSSIFYNSPDEFEKNISLDNVEFKGDSEWETLSKTLTPLLDKLSPLELREDDNFQDVSFLSGESGRSLLIIGTWIISHHLEDKTNKEGLKIKASTFFGFMRQGQPALLYDSLLKDIQDLDRVELIKDTLLRKLCDINPEIQKQLIEKALIDNLIPAETSKNIDAILKNLSDFKLRFAADNSFGAGKGTIKQLLQLTPNADKKQTEFVKSFVEHNGSMSDFWENVEKEKIFTPEIIKDVKLNFELGALTQNHIPLVAELNKQFKKQEISSKRALAKFNSNAWIEIFKREGDNGKPIGVPSNIDGKNEEDKYKTYGAILEQRFERSYPTTSFMAKLERNKESPVSEKEGVVKFLDNNPKFHLDRFRIDHYIAENEESLKDIKNKDLVVQQLKSIQRVFKLSPKHIVVDALLSKNIESAQQIYFMGKEQFVASLKDTGVNKIESKKLYHKSENAYAMAVNLYGSYNHTVNGVAPAGAAQYFLSAEDQEKIKTLPNLQTLFGSMDYCECTHCRSVYSPAAHFVDILRFLGERNTNGTGINLNKKVNRVLLDRRADLGEIELSCENTNTPMPYIDLVNEILEDVVSPPVPKVLNNAIEGDLLSGTIKVSVLNELNAKALPISVAADVYTQDSRNQWAIRDKNNAYKLFKPAGGNLQILPTKQTHLSATELRANPEYTNIGTYDKLSQQVFPFGLPFNLWYLQSRTYLNHLGLSQFRLFELFQHKLDDNVTFVPENLQIDCAWLGINETERKIITGTLVGKQSWDFWGLLQNGNNLPHPSTPTDITTNIRGTWTAVLQNVSLMLHRTGLTYKELLQLLDLKFINPTQSIKINDNIDVNASNCDTTKFVIIGLTPNALDRIHRFIRLWRRLGISMWELDMLLPDMNPDANITDKQITDTALQDISKMSHIKEKFSWEWSEVMALYNNIDHSIYLDRNKSEEQTIQTLYQKLFRNKLVDATAVFPESPKLISGPIQGDSSNSISDKIPGILAAFRINEEELNLILSDLTLNTTSQLDWAILSQIYRITILAKGLDLKINQFLSLKKLAVSNPFDSTSNTLAFIELSETITKSEFSVLELDYLLANKFKVNSGLALEDKAIISTIKAIRDGLQKIVIDLSLKSEETLEAYIKSKLGLLPTLIKDSDQTKALAIINGTWVDSITENRDDLIDIYFKDILDLPIAKTNFASIPPSGTGMTSENRFKYFQPALLSFLLKTQKEIYIKQKISELFQLEVPIADFLLSTLKVEGSTLSLLENLNTEKLLQKVDNDYQFSINEVEFLDCFKSLKMIHKNSLVISKLKIKVEELKWWIEGTHANDLGWPHPKDFPIEATVPVPMEKWINMSVFFAWKNQLPQSELTAFEFLNKLLDGTVDANATTTALSNLATWNNVDISFLITSFRWDVKNKLKDSSAIIRLSKCVDALLRLGINAERAIDWAIPEPTFEIAENMKQTVKSKYDLVQWLEVIKPLQDVFREKKRDALVGYLIYQPDLKCMDTNALYSYFLIDVEMSACMLTSRLKQAAASAQLFVQRCLLNLEEDIMVRAEKTDPSDTLADSKWKQWKWMKYYRVWEANRKVFLYPENWIEPELRDEKSQFFKDLENELMQNDINRDTAEQAYLNYLEKLDNVANLEIRTIYNEINGDESIMHVFGRTRSSLAPEYYYRKRINNGRWTAWEKTGLEIAGNHLVAGIHNRRLYLLWPQFLEKAIEPTSFSIPDSKAGTQINAKPNRYWEIRLFWSELKKGKWTPKVLSDTYEIIYQSETSQANPSNISLRTRLKPHIEVRMYNQTALDSAPIGQITNVFQKLGKQLVANNNEVNTEHLISAPYSIFKNGLLNHTSNSYFFYNSIKEEFDKPHILQATQDAETIRLLNAISPDNSNSVIDSKAAIFESNGTFSFWDSARTYFVDYSTVNSVEYISGNPHNKVSSNFNFYIHYHPFAELFIKELNIWGIKGLLNRRIQVNPENIPGCPPIFDFNSYVPDANNIGKNYELPDKTKSYPIEDVDFSYNGAYSIYNWELFFHAPFHIANKLANNQRFEEALEWYHYIFNPTNIDNAVNDPNTPQQKYWITKPFYETTKADYYKQKIETLMLAIAKGDAESQNQVKEWRDNPFNPHLIARMRTVAYQKSILIKYIQTIIAWGDQLFRRNTSETINEATQLYILADVVLGNRPKNIPKKVNNPIKTFYQLEKSGIDVFGNVLMEVENLLPSVSSSSSMGEESPELPHLNVLYFCIPNNEKLLTLWDTVADRLLKIRSCMNFEGKVQQLPLFDPPIDPGALVRAAAGGLDLSSILNELNAPLPLYRFNFMIQRALDMCNEVKSLGAAMLSALEKKDADTFSLLRSTHELIMMDAVRDVKNKQIDESLRTWESIIEGEKVTQERKSYYERLKNDGLSGFEKASLYLTVGAITAETVGTVLNFLGSGTSLIPEVTAGAAGFGGSPTLHVTLGGKSVTDGLSKAADVSKGIAQILQMSSGMTATMANNNRREEEWDFQKRLAEKELPQIDKQIVAADIRKQMAETELRNHDKQKENLDKELEFMRSKFTNQELYDWMINQISTVYFQSYQLAYDIAKRAERCFRYELGLSDSNYIQFGYWDSLKKGLLSGEKLYFDLKRLETAYYEQNRREYELTKHISLSQIDPVALLKIRQNGECIVDIPETLFDMDYPGHYFRRLKSVSLSIPCIVGPFSTVACTLTLTSNKLRKDSSLQGGKYERDFTNDDIRFRDEIGAIQSITTSGGQSDSGMFELNFRDERYLPFEGAGAISNWHIKLNKDFAQFDLNTISDVIIHLNYTSREGGESLKTQAIKEFNKKMNSIALAENKKGLFRVYDIRREFSNEWHTFLNPAIAADGQQLVMNNLQERLPYFTKNFRNKKVSKIEVVALMKDNTKIYKVMVSPIGNTEADLLSMSKGEVYKGLHNVSKDLTGSEVDLNNWTIKIKENGINDFKSLPHDAIQELFLIINYSIS